MDIKEILSKLYVDVGIDPDYRIASNKNELENGKTMIALERYAKKHSLAGEIAAKLCFCNSVSESLNSKFTSGYEILRDCYGKINYFISPIFDVDSFNSTAALLKAYKKDIRITAVCSGVIPDSVNLALIDETVNISEDDATIYKKDLFETEQLTVGTLSAAALKAATDIAKKICDKHARIVVLFPDIP